MSDLLDRVRAAGGRAQPEWTPERAAANELAMLQRGARRQRTRRVLLATAGVASLGMALVIASTRFDHRSQEGIIRYLDGSVATPSDPGATIKVASSTPTLIASDLTRGGYRFKVVKDPYRTFRVSAGEVRVEVLGTEFRVDRLSEERVRVEVFSGRVRVAWNDQQVELTDGEAGMFPRTNMLGPKPEVIEPSAESNASSAASLHAPARPGKQAWVRLAQSGDYDGAYVALKHATEVARGPAELMLAADAARLSHHAADALPLLRTLLAKYARDPRAPLAAFTLGRVLLDDLGQPRDAAAAFSRVGPLAPTGPLVEDALAREVEAWSRGGDVTLARERADQYLAKYPQGIHVRSVRRFGGVE